MAIKATVYKASLQLADMDRGVYADHTLTLARQPSETCAKPGTDSIGSRPTNHAGARSGASCASRANTGAPPCREDSRVRW